MQHGLQPHHLEPKTVTQSHIHSISAILFKKNVGHVIGGSDPDYNVVAVGDFAGTGISAIMFEDPSNGDTGYYNLAPDGSFTWQRLPISSTTVSVAAH